MVEPNAVQSAFLGAVDPQLFARQVLTGSAPMLGAFHEPGKKVLAFLRIALSVAAIFMWIIALWTFFIWFRNLLSGPQQPIRPNDGDALGAAWNQGVAAGYANIHLGMSVAMFGFGCLFALAGQATAMIYRLGKSPH